MFHCILVFLSLRIDCLSASQLPWLSVFERWSSLRLSLSLSLSPSLSLSLYLSLQFSSNLTDLIAIKLDIRNRNSFCVLSINVEISENKVT